MRDKILDAEFDEFIEKVNTAIDAIEDKQLQVELIMAISVMPPGPYAETEDTRIPVGGRTLIHSEVPDIVVCHLEELAQVVKKEAKGEAEKHTHEVTQIPAY